MQTVTISLPARAIGNCPADRKLLIVRMRVNRHHAFGRRGFLPRVDFGNAAFRNGRILIRDGVSAIHTSRFFLSRTQARTIGAWIAAPHSTPSGSRRMI